MTVVNFVTPTLETTPLSFEVQVTQEEDDEAAWEFEYGVSDMIRDEWGYVFFRNRTSDNSLDDLTFWTEGSYELSIFVYRSGEAEPTKIVSKAFTVDADDTHPTLEQKISEIAEECGGGSEWDTALNLHDWLTLNLYYDQNYEYYGADAVFRGKGVCDAYSKAYKLLCEAAGINAERVTSEEGCHAWNAIQLGGEWYQVDVTWDDPDGSTESVSGDERYDYFCLNDEIMFMDHGWTDWSYNPGCNSLDENYFIKTDTWEELTVYSPDGEKVKDYLLETMDSGTAKASIAANSQGWRYHWSGEYRRIMTDATYGICAYMLNQEEWDLPDGGLVNVEVIYDKNDGLVAVRITGWKIDEMGVLNFPAAIQVIDQEAASGVSATSVVVPENCREIGTRAFAESEIRTVYINSNNLTIADDAFEGCKRILFINNGVYDSVSEYAAENGYLVIEP